MKKFSLSGGDNLKSIDIMSYNASDNLNLQNFKNLEYVIISSKKTIHFDKLKLSKCKKLKSLELYNNVSATNIDLSNFPKLEHVYLNGSVKKLNVSNSKKLKMLFASHLSLKEINVKGCSNLTTQECHDNKLATLDVTGLKSLNR